MGGGEQNADLRIGAGGRRRREFRFKGWRAREEAGVISHYAAVVDRHQVGLSIMGFAHVTLHDHSPEKVRKFDEAIMRAPQVLECHATSGGHDYMLKVVAPDMASYQDFLSEYLLKLGVVRTVNTSFALKQQKNTTVLPLDQVKPEKA